MPKNKNEAEYNHLSDGRKHMQSYLNVGKRIIKFKC